MIIQAELKRKRSEYEGEACAVDKVIELSAQRFQQFSRALLADYDFIVESKNDIRHDDAARHCLLILDADGIDGFLIDPQGYNYARYSAFIPNARSLMTPDMAIDRSYLHAEICPVRSGHLRRMRYTVPPLHMGQQGKKAHCLALCQPHRLWQEILPYIPLRG